jgi:hypothetical protein
LRICRRRYCDSPHKAAKGEQVLSHNKFLFYETSPR